MKRIISVGIVLFWGVMMIWLVRRSSVSNTAPPPPPVPAAMSLSLATQEGWMGIYHQTKKIGYFHRRLVPVEQGYRWEEQSQMKLRMMNTDQLVHTSVRAEIDQRYALQSFSFRLDTSGVVFEVSGKVIDGTTAGSGRELRGQIVSAGNASPFKFPLRDPVYLPSTTQMMLRGASLQPGEERQYSIFNPLTTKTETISVTALGPETLTLKGQQLAVTKIAERFGGTTVHAWLDHEGKVVKEEASLGLVLLRENREDALGGGWEDSTPLDLVASAAIPVQQALPEPRALTRLQLKLVGPEDLPQFAFPPRQEMSGGTITIVSEALANLTTYQLPQTDPAFAPDLSDTPFVQSAHPRLRAQAEQILGSERDAVKAARLLLDWTYTTLSKEPSIGMPTALEALDSKKGDCNEHAVLFTALARAAGIPARVAAGVVYLEGAFYYHAWTDVWLGQWVAVDPVLQQFPADATHVKFIQGGPEEHLALLKVIGQVGMEVITYQ
jgi:Transglutaminase-like superfamily